MSKNPSIGTVPCPIPGCSASCAVKKFAIRHIRDTGKRRAGRFYFDCPDHGRFGWDGRPAMQEYILEKGKLDGAAIAAPDPEPAPPPSAAPPPPPARAANDPPRAAPAAPRKSGFGFFG